MKGGEIREGEKKWYFYGYNEHYNGDFIKTGRKANCRVCGRTIPGDVVKWSRRVLHHYGYKGLVSVRFSYCLRCAKAVIKIELSECEAFQKKIKEQYSKITHADKLHANKRFKEMEFLEKL